MNRGYRRPSRQFTTSRRPPPRTPLPPRKRGRPRLGGLIMLLIFSFTGVLVWQMSLQTMRRTAIVAAGQTGNVYPVDALIIRDETLFDADSVAGLTYIADDGALVSRGAQLAQVYSSAYNQVDVLNLNSRLDDIKRHYASLLSKSTYPDSRLASLDETIDLLVDQIRRSSITPSGGASSLLSYKRQLDRALSERQTYIRQKFPNDTVMTSYTDEEKALRKRIESWTITYIADRPAIVSFYPDGYERMLAASSIEDLTPATARAVVGGAPPELSAVERARVRVYKLVEPRGFYIAALSLDKNWKPQPDEMYRVAVEGLEDTIYDARVTSTTRTGGELLVRFYIDADVSPLLDVRKTRASIGERAVRGLLIPADALYTQDGQIGVVLDLGGGSFVPVQVLTSDAKQAIVLPINSGSLVEGAKIRRF